MTHRPDENPESTTRAILSRVLGIVAILLLYRFPDAVALAVFAVSGLVYYVPRPAAAKCDPPKWIRALLMITLALVFWLMVSVDSPAPAGSRIRPAFAYGLLFILLIQIVWDVVRNRMLKRQNPGGMAGTVQADVNDPR